MTMFKTLVYTVFAVALIAPISFASAANGEKDKLGVLECDVDGGIGMLIGSSKKMNCSFKQSDGSVENYTGKIDKIGVDVGITGKSFIKWVVFTPTGNQTDAHALAGQYAGVSAALTLGIGLGANALIGGNEKKIGLQPLSVEGMSGLNVAVGVSTLTLVAAE